AEVEQHGWLQTRDPIALPALLQEAATAAQVRAQAAGVELHIEQVPDLRVQGDGYLLRQALHNLIDNAIAFSPPGAQVQLDAQRDGQGVRLQVADRGAGIPDYARERVFERFYSLARPGTGRRSSGLGLPFVQEVARLH
ncbi:two-component system sensor histidine kinase CreC, partial [Stenotrophomonas sp. HMWF022]